MASSRAALWGLAVFALGILLLLVVFILSYGLFASAGHELESVESVSSNVLPPLTQFLAIKAVGFAFLLVMGYVSSLIAGKGLSLYGSSREARKE